MDRRCRCGASLIAELAHCVMCGAAWRPQAVAVGAGRHAAGPAPVPAPPAVPRFAGPPAAPQHPAAPVWAYPAPPVAPPAPAPQRSSAPWIVGAAAVVVLAVAAALAVLVLRPIGVAAPTTAPATVVAPQATAAPVPYAASGSDTSDTSDTSDDSDALDAQVSTDRAAVEGLVGEWVPQLSSKAVGTVDDGVVYDAEAILGHYRGLVASYPDAKLLDSGDWPVFNRAGYRVVVVATPFTTAGEANSWCAAQGLPSDQCFAKKLSHSGGPAGTTVQR